MTARKFATAINCMDGRVQLPVINWMKERYNVDYVDMITEPGPELLLSANNDHAAIESIRKRLEISVTKHYSNLVAVITHHDCAGNPTDAETQHMQVLDALSTVESWNLNVQVIGLQIDENWQVHQIE